MDVCLLWVLYVGRQKSLRRARHSSGGVLLSVMCLRVMVKPQHWRGRGPLGGCHITKKQNFLLQIFSETAILRGLWNQNQHCFYPKNQLQHLFFACIFTKQIILHSTLLQLLISSTMHLQMMDKIMETTYIIGKNLFMFAALKKH